MSEAWKLVAFSLLPVVGIGFGLWIAVRIDRADRKNHPRK